MGSCSIVLAIGMVLATGVPCEAQSCLDTAGFVRTNGKDTLAVERVETTPTRVIGVQTFSSSILRYDLTDRQNAESVGVQEWEDGTRYLVAPPTQAEQLTINGQRAIFVARVGDVTRIRRSTLRQERRRSWMPRSDSRNA